MKDHRPRISQETYERIMLDSTGVSYGYNSFEEALSNKLLNNAAKQNELIRHHDEDMRMLAGERDGPDDCFELEDDNWCVPLRILEIL